MQNNGKTLVRKYKEKKNLVLSLGIIGMIFIVISLFFVPLMKEETRRFGENVVVYDHFAMTLFHIFVVIGILLLITGVVLTVFCLTKTKKVLNHEDQN